MDRVFQYINGVIIYACSDNEYTKIHARRNAVIQIAIATIAFILMMRVFPAQIVQNHVLSRQKGYNITSDISGDVFTHEEKKLQTVCFTDSHIYQIKLYMHCVVNKDASSEENILFRLYNADFSCIYELEADNNNINRIAENGYLIAAPDMDVEPGVPYYYEIIVDEECKNEYRLPVAPKQALAQKENSTLFINGIINDEVCLVADFEYTSPLNFYEIVLWYLLIIAAAFTIWLLCMTVIRICDEYLPQNRNIDLEQLGNYVRMTVAAVSMILAAALFVYAVVLNKFGGELWDRLFFTVGIIVFEMWLLVALWRMPRVIRPAKRSKLPADARICLIWRSYVQTVSFGLLFYALCQYVNADRNFYHYTNTRWMLIFLAAAFLMNYNEKQFMNKLSAVWLALVFAGSIFYCNERFNVSIRNNIIYGNPAKAGEDALLLARLDCGVVTAWGLLILTIIVNNILKSVREKSMNLNTILQKIKAEPWQAVYIVLWVVFSLLMYAYRFEKVWVFTATLPFAALLPANSRLSSKGRFLKNFTNGILLSFAFTTLFCLQHRPHHYWMLYRYGGIFHTVACTGMYLAVVFGAAFAKLYGKLKLRRNMIIFCYSEYFVTACVAGFILLTMSRTAFLTTAVTIFAIVILTAVTYHKSVKRIAAELGVFAAVCLISFPMVFTAVRMVPAVVNDPIRYDIEFQDRNFMVYEGDPIDSDKYMTVRRFFCTLFGRFQTQPDAGETADAGLTVHEAGVFAYTGDGFAGLEMLAADSGSPAMETDSEDDENDKNDISNGRFEIFGDYINAIKFKGHPKMGPENAKGEEYAHAHNSYLQIAYNFGIIAGVVFLILCALTLWRSVQFYMEYGRKYNIFLIPFALVIVFGFISLTEWAFHPCIPAGFCFILMQVFLMRIPPSQTTG